jgi:hypothetical protein
MFLILTVLDNLLEGVLLDFFLGSNVGKYAAYKTHWYKSRENKEPRGAFTTVSTSQTSLERSLRLTEQTYNADQRDKIFGIQGLDLDYTKVIIPAYQSLTCEVIHQTLTEYVKVYKDHRVVQVCEVLCDSVRYSDQPGQSSRSLKCPAERHHSRLYLNVTIVGQIVGTISCLYSPYSLPQFEDVPVEHELLKLLGDFDARTLAQQATFRRGRLENASNNELELSQDPNMCLFSIARRPEYCREEFVYCGAGSNSLQQGDFVLRLPASATALAIRPSISGNYDVVSRVLISSCSRVIKHRLDPSAHEYVFEVPLEERQTPQKLYDGEWTREQTFGNYFASLELSIRDLMVLCEPLRRKESEGRLNTVDRR